MMDQHRMWRTKGIVLESVKIGQYISDMKNSIMAKQMQRQAMYPKRSLYCNKCQNLKAKHKWECGMSLSAEERHKHHQALCKWLLHNCNPCEECNIRVVLMVDKRHHIPYAK